jgi:hypothetical protein
VAPVCSLDIIWPEFRPSAHSATLQPRRPVPAREGPIRLPDEAVQAARRTSPSGLPSQLRRMHKAAMSRSIDQAAPASSVHRHDVEEEELQMLPADTEQREGTEEEEGAAAIRHSK